MDDNSETNEDGGTRTSSPKTPHLKWTNTHYFKELEKYENLSGPKHSLPVGSSEKDSRKLKHKDVTAVVWQVKRVVLLLSTNSDPQTDDWVTRKTEKDNEETEIACPQAVINYKKHMGGVDVSDQKREYYGVSQSSKKWWKSILHFVLNVFLMNCFILCDLKNHPPSTTHGNRQVTFRRNLVRQLMGTFLSCKRTGRKKSLPIGTAFPNLFHTLQKILGRAKVCALCIEKKKKAPSGRGKQTTYKCKQCDLPLYRVGCFLEYHEQ